MDEANTQGTSQASIAPSDLPEESHVDHPAVPSSSSSQSEGSNQCQQRIDDQDELKKVVDTAAPIDSVKGAVSKFGGIVDWREKRTQIQDELDKVQVEISKYQKRSQEADAAMKELQSTSSVVDELRLGVETAQAEEAQARRGAEAAELRLREVERGASESAAARAELGVVRDRSAAAVADLQAARAELAALEKERAAADAARAREAGKAVEELAGELVALKRELESAQAAHGEVEEKRVAIAEALEQDKSQWQSELEEAEVEAKRLREQLMAACDLELKAEAASEELASLRAQLSAKRELEDVKGSIGRAKGEAYHLRVAADALRGILDKGKAELAALQRKEQLSAAAIAALEDELSRATSELTTRASKEEDVDDSDNKDKHEQVGEARREAEQANAKAQTAREEVAKVREEAAVVKAAVAALEARLQAVTREIVAANTSEEMAAASATALLQLQLEESNNNNNKPSSIEGDGVTLTAEEYEELSRRARETEEVAGERVVQAVKLIKEAKDAEVRSLENLTRAAKHTEQRRQALQAATEEAEEAEFAKLSAERELRQWRADHDPHPRPGLAEISVLDDTAGVNNPHILSPRGGYMMPRNDAMMAAAGAAAEAEARQRKTTFLPRMVMFLARKKAHNWK